MTEETTYLSTQQAARVLGLSAKTLARYRVAFVRLGHNPGLSNSNRNRLSDLPDGLFAHNPLLEQIFNYVVNGNASGFTGRIAPVADAGADFTAHAGETVTLDASASTSRVFGANVTHVWRQSDSSGLGAAPVQGAVSHGAFRGPRGTVTLPAVTAPTELELRVRGSDVAQAETQAAAAGGGGDRRRCACVAVSEARRGLPGGVAGAGRARRRGALVRAGPLPDPHPDAGGRGGRTVRTAGLGEPGGCGRRCLALLDSGRHGGGGARTGGRAAGRDGGGRRRFGRGAAPADGGWRDLVPRCVPGE